LISIRDLKRQTGLKKEVSLKFKFKEIGGVEVLSPVEADLMIENRGVGFKITGTYRVKLKLRCRRCLEFFDYELTGTIDEMYTKKPYHFDEKIKLTKEELSTFYYHGDEINVREMIRQNILVSIPPYPLCKPDCKGLCPVCGKNLNYGECEHVKEKEEEIEENPFYRLYVRLMEEKYGKGIKGHKREKR